MLSGRIWGQVSTVFLALFFSHAAYGQSPQLDQRAQPQTPSLAPSNQNASLLTPMKPQPKDAPYVRITSHQRLRWIVSNSIGPAALVVGTFGPAFGTAIDRPEEYGPHWEGFGERYGLRLTGIIPSNIMEAEIGTVWGEDPRYFRAPDQHFGGRVKNIVKQTFVARRPDGAFAPAYARFIGITGSSFLSNTWRPESEANTHDALIRSLEGFGGRMATNAFEEFWPDAKAHLFHRSN